MLDWLTSILRQSAAGDRRRSDRQARDRDVRLRTGEDWENCHLNDVSTTGAGIEARPDLKLGEHLEIDIPEKGVMSAIVQRQGEGQTGLKFD